LVYWCILHISFWVQNVDTELYGATYLPYLEWFLLDSSLLPFFQFGQTPSPPGFFFLGGLGLAGLLAHDPEFSSLSERSFDVESLQHDKPPSRDNSFTAKHSSTIGCIRFGVGFGTLVFLTHWLCTSHGVIARWIGIEPFPSGVGIVASIALGVYLNNYPNFVRSIWWWLAAVIAGPCILITSPRVAIVLGYLVTTYIMSIWHVAVADLSKHGSPVLTLNISMLVYLFGMLGVIWSIAWCFVPPGTGGPWMRQRVGQLFAMALLFVSLSYFKGTSPHLNKSSPSTKSPKPAYSTKQILQILALIIVIITIPAIIKRGASHGNFDGNGVQTEYIRGMIWAIRFGYNNFGWPNFKDVARKIKEVKSNLVGLVETDTLRPFTGNRDIVEFLQEHLHMYSDFGPSTLNETWGCALLSAYPIIRSERENQPSPDGEIACLIDATIDHHGTLIDVLVTHFGNTEHYRDRELQAQEIARRVAKKKEAGRKVVWLGYLTDRAGGPNYNRLIEAGLTDASPQAVERYCLYLFHMGMEISEFQRIEMKEDISDTEIQIANFKLPSAATVAKK